MTTGPDWAEQARRLLEALRSTPPAEGEGEGEGDAQHAAECRWCPHCQVLAVLRGDRPELVAVLGDVLATAAAALRAFAGETPPTGAAEAPDGAPSHRDPAPTVQRIEIA